MENNMKKWQTVIVNPGDKPTKTTGDLNSLFNDGYELDSTTNLSSGKNLFFLTKEVSDRNVDGLYDTMTNIHIERLSAKKYETYNYLYVYATDESAKKDLKYAFENLNKIDELEVSLALTPSSPYNVTTFASEAIGNSYNTNIKYTYASIASLASSPWFDGAKFDTVTIESEVVENLQDYESDFYKAMRRLEGMRVTTPHN